jgi:hypothetical protein
MNNSTDKVTRVEVIDQDGRSYVNWDDNNKVELSFQDDGRTLKVFISNREKALQELEKTGITSYNGTFLMTEF